MAISGLLDRELRVGLANKPAATELVNILNPLSALGGSSDTLDATAAELNAAADVSTRIVTTTAATIAVTATAHSGRIMVLNSTHTQTVTLPASSGGGDIYRFQVGTKGTDGSKVIKVANATDILQGFSHIVQTDVTQVAGFGTTATDDTATFNNTTQGGFVGDDIEIRDIKSGTFSVRVLGRASGTVITPFSAGV